jgi:GNAT superfamily N-acetyltransferase
MSDLRNSDVGRLSVQIRGAGHAHWSDIRSLHALSFRKLTGPAIDSGQCEAFVSRMFAPDYTAALQTNDLQVAVYDGRTIGTAGWVPGDDRGTIARITSVFVSPIYSRLGVGRQLVAAAEARARAAGYALFLARAFQPSTGFFETLGYARSSQGVHALGSEEGIPVVFLRKQDVSPLMAQKAARTGCA